MTWKDIEFFRPYEFDSPDSPGSGQKMDLSFVQKLDQLRKKLGFPLVVQSGFRTPEHNAQVGGVDCSAHEAGKAADLRALSSGTRFAILSAALNMGFTRIGIGKTFVHLDDDPTKPKQVAWLY